MGSKSTALTHIVTGLPAMGKTFQLERVATEYGIDLGARRYPYKPGLELGSVLTWTVGIAAKLDRIPNVAFTHWSSKKHDAAVEWGYRNRPEIPRDMPTAVKIVTPAAVPVIRAIYPDVLVSWCVRSFNPWKRYLESIQYADWRGNDPVEVYGYYKILLDCFKSDSDVVFDVDTYNTAQNTASEGIE